MYRKEYFEGDFRREPSQNFSGNQRNLQVLEFIEKVQNERKKREAYKQKMEKVLILQSIYRGKICRNKTKVYIKNQIDCKISEMNEKLNKGISLILHDIEFIICRICVIYSRNFHNKFTTKKDTYDPKIMIYASDLVSRHRNMISLEIKRNSEWLWRISTLFHLFLDFIKIYPTALDDKIQIINAIKGPMDFFMEVDSSNDIHNITLLVAKKLLLSGLFMTLLKLAEEINSQKHSCYYKSNPVDNWFKIILRLTTSTNDIHFKNLSLQCMAKEVLCTELSTETKNIVLLLIKTTQNFPFQDLCDQLMRINEITDTIHPLDNFLNCWNYDRVSSLNEQKKYFQLLSKLTMILPLSIKDNSLSTIEKTDCKGEYDIINNCRNHINNRKITDIWYEFATNTIKRKDYDGLFWFSKCLYHFWLYDCSPVYETNIIKNIALNPEILKEFWSFTNSEKRILSFSSQLYSATVMSLLASGVLLTFTEADRVLPALTMFCFLLKNHISLTNNEMQCENDLISKEKKGHKFTLDEILSVCSALKETAIGIIYLAYPSTSLNGTDTRIDVLTPTEHLEYNTMAWRRLFEQLMGLLRLIHDRDSKQKFTKDMPFWPSDKIIETCISFTHLKNIEGIYPFSPHMEIGDRRFTIYENRYLSTIITLPFTVEFLKRCKIYQNCLTKSRSEFQDPAIHFLQVPHVLLRIRRDYIYEDAFENIYFEPDIRKCIRVYLINSLGVEELGVDGGGLFREFMVEFFKTAFDLNRGFFVMNRENEFYPNPNVAMLGNEYITHYKFIGRMLGKALFENMVVDVPLADLFLNGIVDHNNDLYINDLATLDPDLYRNLLSLTYSKNVSELGLDFSLAVEGFGESKIIELKPNGKNITVSDDNVLEYIHLVAHFKTRKLIHEQMSAFFDGLNSVIPLEWLQIFTTRELQLIISGNKSPINIDDMRKHATYSGGYSKDHPTITMFWQVVASFNAEQRGLLLQFVTSCSRPPLLGFKDLFPPLCIQHVDNDDRLPSSSTCMNILKLPEFTNEEILKERLLYAIQSRSGFEMV